MLQALPPDLHEHGWQLSVSEALPSWHDARRDAIRRMHEADAKRRRDAMEGG